MILAPFPYFGGKSKAAEAVWDALGSVGTYIEPFAGSCAVALNRPSTFNGWITLNDADGLLVNFWRAMQRYPDQVAEHAANPVIEADLHARHLWLVNNRERITSALMADEAYCDPKAAGWWAWGACCWIGGGWCGGDGPWVAVEDDDGTPMLVHSASGNGVNKKVPHLGDAGRGVNKQMPHLSGGQGVNKQVSGTGREARLEFLRQWFGKLSDLFYAARITCGDWSRVCSVGTMTRNGVAGVLLDPPYSLTKAVYAMDSSSVAADVRAWCKENGNNPMLRIVLCGHAGEGHEELESMGWTVRSWNKGGGYQGADDRERLWLSPHCQTGGLFNL